jgi:hypothetical protein
MQLLNKLKTHSEGFDVMGIIMPIIKDEIMVIHKGEIAQK